jgi:hypothetical protein
MADSRSEVWAPRLLQLSTLVSKDEKFAFVAEITIPCVLRCPIANLSRTELRCMERLSVDRSCSRWRFDVP